MAEAFIVEGLVIEARSIHTYQVELANGHRLLAFVAGKAKQSFAGLAPGEKVTLQLTPFDLTMGRILTERKTI